MFHPHEVEVAIELVEDRLHKGLASGYYFLFAEFAGEAVGYACYGPIACTANSYDLFWIAVRNDLRGKGLGRTLIERSEAAIAQLGGKAIYIETSSRDVYRPTRAFYRRCGYREAATLKDFYGPGDDRIIFLKHLP